jgi:adenine-specific DNA methylase
MKAHTNVALTVIQVDVTTLGSRVREKADAVITSPPYNIAVNYYRRHLLEMYWLGLTNTHEDRLALLPKYIGRDKVPKRHPFVSEGKIETPLVESWERQIRKSNSERADAFKHYVVAMRKAFREIARVLKPEGYALFVVGHSRWNGKVIPTSKLFVELAGPSMVLVEKLWYPVANRYMSYSRHNGASIDTEYVLVFKRAQ